MNKKKLYIILFAVLMVIQLAVPIGMIVSREVVLSRGEIYKFEIAPVDPYDIFRGRYVTLRVAAFTGIRRSFSSTLKGSSHGYVILRPFGSYWVVKDAVLEKPADGDFLKVDVDGEGRVIPPFDRYYLNQKVAPAIEKLLWSGFGRGKETYISVRISRGKGVIEQLFIEGRSVEEIVEEKGL